MVPDFALRIQAMSRAMREVVLPAIPKDQKLAMDQANIVIGNLRIMAQQQDKLVQYILVELREYAQLIGALLERAEGDVETRDAVAQARSVLTDAKPIAAMLIPPQGHLAALTKSLKQAADDLLRAAHADGSAAFRKSADELVFQQSQAQILRERAWVRSAGFELEPDALPSLDEILR